MKSPSPMLLPLLRSRAQGEVLAWIMLHPEEEFSLVELAESVGVSPPTVMREVDRMVAAGLVSDVRRGNQRMVRAETENAVFRPLAVLMAVTFGPVPVMREMLSPVAGIREAGIYGSWAARYAEQPGPVPGDLDVLVVGDADLDELDDVAHRASQRLHREVNIRRVRPRTWDQPKDDSFKRTVMGRPLVWLIGCDER
jgi:DNA-binding transcriptional ArsR family regulator